jgi:hypothetical protein
MHLYASLPFSLVIGPLDTSNESLAWLSLVLGWSTSSFVDEKTNAGEDVYDFAYASQGIRFGSNRARRNLNFHGMGNYEDVDGEMESIKLEILNF